MEPQILLTVLPLGGSCSSECDVIRRWCVLAASGSGACRVPESWLGPGEWMFSRAQFAKHCRPARNNSVQD